MNEQPIRIILAGPRGKMGRETLELLAQTENFRLVACVDTKNAGRKVSEISGLPQLDAPIFDNAEKCAKNVDADVWIDFTHPEAGKKHARLALSRRIRPVIGTSGFGPEEVKLLSRQAEENHVGAIIAPNFALGAVLMMKFSKVAARYLPDVEIIEQHHNEKRDAPSGTALKTAEMIADTRKEKQQGHPEEKEQLPGARGADFAGMKIHSVRLPGRVAHQTVIFGGSGETLTLQHDSLDRKSFMSGVKFAVEAVMDLNVLVYGLEHLIE